MISLAEKEGLGTNSLELLTIEASVCSREQEEEVSPARPDSEASGILDVLCAGEGSPAGLDSEAAGLLNASYDGEVSPAELDPDISGTPDELYNERRAWEFSEAVV